MNNIKQNRSALRQHFTVLSLILICALLTACSSDEIKVSAQFANTNDIEEGTPVYFNQAKIGEVTDVEVEKHGSTVAMRLEKQAAAEVYAQSAVVVNRLKEGAPLEIVNRETGNGEPLLDGQEIEGLDSMVQLGAWVLGDAIQVGVGAISNYVDAFQNYLQSEEFQNDKDQFEVEINGAAVSAEQAMQTLGQELNKAMKEFAASEDEMVAAVDSLGDELAPLAESLAENGVRLAEEMDGFAKSLENRSVEEREAGQRVLESLITMLEKINDGLEKGSGKAE